MPITVTWLDDRKTITHWVLTDPWTLEELYAANEADAAMIRSVPHTVCSLIDTQGVTVPRTLFTALNGLSRNDPPNYDMSAIITHSAVIRALLSMYQRMPHATLPFKLFATHEEALRFLEDRMAQYPSETKH